MAFALKSKWFYLKNFRIRQPIERGSMRSKEEISKYAQTQATGYGELQEVSQELWNLPKLETEKKHEFCNMLSRACLLYTSDAADE